MESPALKKIFKGFDGMKVMIIGDVMIDTYIRGTVDRISPEAPVPVVKTHGKDYRLGGAANVALNVQSLGGSPILCSVIGADSSGKRFIERLEEKGMTSKGIVKSDERTTTVKTRVLSGYQHIVRVDDEDDHDLTEEDEKSLIDNISKLMDEVAVIIFEDYNKGTITERIIREVIEIAKSKNIPTAVDPKKKNFLQYKNSTLFKPNLKELKEGLNLDFTPDSETQIEEAVKELKSILECDGLLLTLSSKGVYIDYNGEKHHIPAHVRSISDVSGAGDTVISVAAMALALGLSPKIIAELANLGGGLVCEHVGVVPVIKDELMEEARQYLN